MPVYDYSCKECGHTFEEFHGMTKRLKKCPKCLKLALVRLIGTGAAFRLKGEGFYATKQGKEGKII